MESKKDIILHIGRSKSGTSTLQQYLTMHRRQLGADGICYPKTGCGKRFAHHDIAVMCRSLVPFGKTLRETRQAFENETERFGKVILSSEGFQQLLFTYNLRYFFGRNASWLRTAANLGSALSDPVPEYRITTICYLREYLEYACSSYTQAVQNSNQTDALEKYCRKHFGRPLNMFVRLWQKFSDQSLFLAYDRKRLIEGDIVADFFHRIGVPMPSTSVTSDANPSISGNLLAFKLLLNRHVPHSKALYRTFAELAQLDPRYRGKMFVSEAAAAALRAGDRGYNSELERLVGRFDLRSFEKGQRFDAERWALDMERFLTHPTLSALKDRPEIYRTSATEAARLLPE